MEGGRSPIVIWSGNGRPGSYRGSSGPRHCSQMAIGAGARSEEHTSELQSQSNLVCRLLLEKKKRATANRGHAGKATVHVISTTPSDPGPSHIRTPELPRAPSRARRAPHLTTDSLSCAELSL